MPEFIPNTPGHAQRIFKLITDKAGKGTGKFLDVTVMERPSGHGIGFGDIHGDGRTDIVLAKGWLEASRLWSDPFKDFISRPWQE